jgi:hypothetical protein
MKYLFVVALVLLPAALCGTTDQKDASEALAQAAQQIQAANDGTAEVKPPDAFARQGNQASNVLSNFLQPLNPTNFLNNLIPGRSAERE